MSMNTDYLGDRVTNWILHRLRFAATALFWVVVGLGLVTAGAFLLVVRLEHFAVHEPDPAHGAGILLVIAGLVCWFAAYMISQVQKH